MRIWSLHPRYLDRQGLTACWRESLLAQAVLAGRTRGYRNHGQLIRFRECPDPLTAIGGYLAGVAAEADARSYHFDRRRIMDVPGEKCHGVALLPVTDGQVAYEWSHLMSKLRHRSPERAASFSAVNNPEVHSLFRLTSGPVAPWEKV